MCRSNFRSRLSNLTFQTVLYYRNVFVFMHLICVESSACHLLFPFIIFFMMLSVTVERIIGLQFQVFRIILHCLRYLINTVILIHIFVLSQQHKIQPKHYHQRPYGSANV
ncbi:hypothetical protein V8G54_028372 [Vigna mungo]|uniref:Uncharacterized protein n=1 Tax=Vigna mungo TaxID=3915 RepID=A0AAQ3RJC3_VIGMU